MEWRIARIALVVLVFGTGGCYHAYIDLGDGDHDADASAEAEAVPEADAYVEAAPDGEVDDVADIFAEAETVADVVPEADADADADAELPNLGAPCTSDVDCTGSGAWCMTEWSMPVASLTFLGGYCSSRCEGTTLSCGPDGFCMDGTAFGGPQTCMRRCDPSGPDECRVAEGYFCSNVMIFPEPFCAPSIPSSPPGG